jgi:hypothetical protein
MTLFIQKKGDSMESELFKQMLKGVTYSWDLDPIDRSWFIWPTGEIIGDISHHLILKNTFKKEWQDMIKRGAEDAEIEHTFEKRLILSGTIKIGELNKFYAKVGKLTNREKDVIQGFAKSISKIRNDALSKELVIHQTNGEPIKCTISDILNDYLSTIIQGEK